MTNAVDKLIEAAPALRDALQELAEVSGQSVELDSWPELRAALDRAFALLDDL